jgi:hypothetical protein
MAQAYHHQITVDSMSRERERLHELARHDEASALLHARDEGEAKGRAEESFEIVQKMKTMGFSNEQIKTVIY